MAPLCLFPALMASGSLQNTFNSLHSRSGAEFEVLPTSLFQPQKFSEGSWAQSVAAASFACVLHFAWGVLSHQLISRTNWALAASGFNEEMPPWAWQVGKSL